MPNGGIAGLVMELPVHRLGLRYSPIAGGVFALAVRGMPVGVQLMGQPHEDARMTAIARWLAATLQPVAIG